MIKVKLKSTTLPPGIILTNYNKLKIIMPKMISNYKESNSH